MVVFSVLGTDFSPQDFIGGHLTLLEVPFAKRFINILTASVTLTVTIINRILLRDVTLCATLINLLIHNIRRSVR